MSKEKKSLLLLKNRNLNKPDAKAEDESPTLRRYFKLLGRKFWKIVSLNLMMLPQILPILLCVYLFFSAAKTPTENSLLFSPLFGANLIASTPATGMLLDLFGEQLYIPAFGYSTYIWMGICILLLALTFGWQNVGCTYILRSMVRGEPTFLFSDYRYAVKRNLKQGFFFGLFDFAVLGILTFDIISLWQSTGEFMQDLMFFLTCGVAIIYFLMRFYLYLMLVTFELSFRKLLKNALIFSMLGIKRNLLAILGIALFTGVNLLLFLVFSATPLGIAIPLILPLLYFLGICSFTTAYAAYPVIDRYMIAPFQKAESEETEATNPESAD